jgi:hypothetical protein
MKENGLTDSAILPSDWRVLTNCSIIIFWPVKKLSGHTTKNYVR